MRELLICIGNGSVGKISIDTIRKKKIYKKIKIINISKKINKLILDNKIKKINNKNIPDIIIGFANIKNLKRNEQIFDILKNSNYKLINVIHETAIIDENTYFGKGVKVFPGAIINRGCKIKNNVLINTGSVIEHDCIIGEHSQIAPSCNLAGNVKIGKLSLVGMGSTIIQGVKIGKNCIIGAGSVVLKNVPDNSIYAGSPARKIK